MDCAGYCSVDCNIDDSTLCFCQLVWMCCIVFVINLGALFPSAKSPSNASLMFSGWQVHFIFNCSLSLAFFLLDSYFEMLHIRYLSSRALSHNLAVTHPHIMHYIMYCLITVKVQVRSKKKHLDLNGIK